MGQQGRRPGCRPAVPRAAGFSVDPGPTSIRNIRPPAITAVHGPARSALGSGEPLPQMTTCRAPSSSSDERFGGRGPRTVPRWPKRTGGRPRSPRWWRSSRRDVRVSCGEPLGGFNVRWRWRGKIAAGVGSDWVRRRPRRLPPQAARTRADRQAGSAWRTRRLTRDDGAGADQRSDRAARLLRRLRRADLRAGADAGVRAAVQDAAADRLDLLAARGPDPRSASRRRNRRSTTGARTT